MATSTQSTAFDWPLFSLYLALLAIGWGMLYSVGYGEGYDLSLSDFLLQTQVGKQTIWIGVSLVGLFFIYLIDATFWRTFAYPIFGVTLILLIGVLLFGNEIKGATSWFRVAGFTLQPSELAKFGTALAVAGFLSQYSTDMRTLRDQAVAFGMLLVPMGLILLQPDAGSALVFLAFLVPFYREGFPAGFFVVGFLIAGLLILGFRFEPLYVIGAMSLAGLYLLARHLPHTRYWMLGLTVLAAAGIYLAPAALPWVTATGVVLFLGLASYHFFGRQARLATLLGSGFLVGALLVFAASWSFDNLLKSHQQDRINVWLNPAKCDPQGSLYNLLQSKMAIGSGRLMGKGFLAGNLTKGNYVPEQSTDFIFCTVGEEHGFVGSLSIIALFLLLLFRITQLAERQRTPFARSFAYGVAGIFFIHFVINIGMTMGLMPIIGIPLPFISKGGSAMLGFTLLIGVLLKLDGEGR